MGKTKEISVFVDESGSYDPDDSQGTDPSSGVVVVGFGAAGC